MEEYRGSIFAQAKLDGIDYRPILKRAVNLDKTALVSLFTMKFMGEGGDTHCANLRDLMHLWGDAKFAEVLVSQPKEVRALVVSSIDYTCADSDWIPYPRTLAASPESITKRPEAGQAIMAKDQDSPSGLIASVLVESGSGAGNENKGTPKFLLTNTGKTSIRVCGDHQIWRHESASQTLLIITSESFKTNTPTEKQFRESIKVLEPGMSFSINLPSGILNQEKEVQITYEVSENFAKKFDIWQGKLQLNFGSGLHEPSK